MTEEKTQKRKFDYKTALPELLCLAITLITLLCANELRESVINGIKLSVFNIIPTLFPFLVLSDYWISVMSFGGDGFLGKAFRKFFKIDGIALSAFLAGIFCGFPLGVKTATDLYRSNRITKHEAERLCGFINNPSLAFVISGVGVGMYGSIEYGILLYISVILSSVIVGILFSKNSIKISKGNEISEQKFDLVLSIKSAGLSSLTISSYIIFFSAVLGLLLAVTKSDLIVTVISPLLEVGNATSMIAKNTEFTSLASRALCAFSLGFSGFSVHLQSFAFFPNEFSKAKYLMMKLIQGILCALIILPLVSLL